MMSAQQAAQLTNTSLKLQLVYEQIENAAKHNRDCVIVKHLDDDLQNKLQQDGYKLLHDECSRGMSFWVISWKHACM